MEDVENEQSQGTETSPQGNVEETETEDTDENEEE